MNAGTSAIPVTFFDDAFAKTKREQRLTLSDLAELIAGTTAPQKDMLPWLKLCRFGNLPTEKKSLRWDGNVLSVNGVELDYDGEKIAFVEAVEIAANAGLLAIIYTSPSHASERPRWRMLCPTSGELKKTDRAHMAARVNGLYGGIFAAESWALSQSYYFGSVNNNPAHQVELIDGHPIDELDELDEIAIGKPGTKANGADHSQRWTGHVDEAALLEEIRTGTSYHTASVRLLGLWAQQSVAFMDAQRQLLAEFDVVDESKRDDRWRARRDDVPRMVRDIYGKEAGKTDTEKAEPDGSLIIDHKAPFTVAKILLQTNFTKKEIATLHHHRDSFYAWNGAAYPDLAERAIRCHVYNFLDQCHTRSAKGDLRRVKPNMAMTANLLDALRAAAHLEDVISAPAWLEQTCDLDAADILACANGLLHLPTRELLPHTPLFFTHNALDFAYKPTAPDPVEWLRFLAQLWPDDPRSIETLQEIFGYCLTADTTQQKMFLIVGPKRSGKGTIGRVLMRLVGVDNTIAPTLAGIAMNFGLAPLIGKRVAIMSDARLGGRADQHAIAERLLSITGEDSITVDRKYQEAWTGRLQTRFVVLSNELPRLADASGALASRFIVLVLTESFYGREDHALTARLLTELPSILNWSITGLNRLHDRSYFLQPTSAADAVQVLEDLGSPISAFLRDRCTLGSQYHVERNALFEAWIQWCKNQGRDHSGTAESFGRDLRAAVPTLKTSNLRIDGDKRLRFYEGIGLR